MAVVAAASATAADSFALYLVRLSRASTSSGSPPSAIFTGSIAWCRGRTVVHGGTHTQAARVNRLGFAGDGGSWVTH